MPLAVSRGRPYQEELTPSQRVGAPNVPFVIRAHNGESQNSIFSFRYSASARIFDFYAHASDKWDV